MKVLYLVLHDLYRKLNVVTMQIEACDIEHYVNNMCIGERICIVGFGSSCFSVFNISNKYDIPCICVNPNINCNEFNELMLNKNVINYSNINVVFTDANVVKLSNIYPYFNTHCCSENTLVETLNTIISKL